MELRKDYILDRWVIISEGRGKRPKEFQQDKQLISTGKCFFCPGNEHLTPPEIYRVEKNGHWQVRVFPNKFPAVMEEGNPEITTHNTFYTFSNAFGKHEVIVETPLHQEQLYDLDENRLQQVLETYQKRMKALESEPFSKYVVLFKNHGHDAGTSLYHSHTQMLCINTVPALIRQEVQVAKQYSSCPYCQLIPNEAKSYRRCFENEDFVAFTPYASRFNYEIWLFPKKHIRSLVNLTGNEIASLSKILRQVLMKLRELGAGYNFYLHYSPDKEDLHFHFEFTPRNATWAGFEIGTDAVINSVSPEEAAKFYRGENKTNILKLSSN